MKMLSWNVQGAKGQQICEEIRFLTRTQRPDILFVLEIMVNKIHTKRMITKLGYDNYDICLPVNHLGGFWVLWNNNNIIANVLYKDNIAIHSLVFNKCLQKISTVSGFHALPQLQDKNSFSYLLHLNSFMDQPWCLIWDFNELENPSKNFRGTLCPASMPPITWLLKLHKCFNDI